MRYRIDPRRVTFKEMQSEASFPIAILGWLITRLPIKVPCSSEYPAVDSLKPYLISKHDVPEKIKEVFQDLSDELEQLGFRGTLYHCIEDPLQRTTIYYASLLHKSGAVLARLNYRVFRATTPYKKYLVTELMTRMGDGSFIVTSSSPGDLETPDSIQNVLLPKASCQQLWTTHRERLDDPQYRSNVVKVRDGQHLLDLEEEYQGRICAHFVERRLFVEAPGEEIPAEVSAETSLAEPVGHDLASPAESTPVGDDKLFLDEIRKLEDKPATSWEGLVLTLAVSIGLFIAAGGLVWDWNFTLLLVPILLFHELGHYLSMKLFDYSNVKMFFIPLFGAAVTGRHYNVPGWKKIFTSLMGPVPGIVLGTGLGIIAILNEYDSLLDASMLMLVLNGFNLLPTLPLDGGWVMHGLLFSRHAFLDIIFRLLAIGLCFFAAAVGIGKLLLFIGIAMCVALPMSYHAARICDRLRAAGGFADKPTEGHIPLAAVQQISVELDRAFPKGLDIRAKAKLALQIFENVNSTPPGWIASLSLGMIYLASLATVVVAGSVFFVAKHSDLDQLLADAAFGPQNEIVVEEIVRIPAASKPIDFVADETMVINFSDRQTAAAALEQLRGELPGQGRLLLVGSTIMLPIVTPDMAAQKDKWFDRFEADGSLVFLSSPETISNLSLQFIAPTAEVAEQIEASLMGLFVLPENVDFVPPWHDRVSLMADEIRARQTVRKLASQEWMEDEEIDDEIDEETDEAIATAQRRGQKEKVKQLQDEIRQRYQRRLEEYLTGLRELPAEDIDLELLDLYEAALKKAAAEPNDEEGFFDVMPALPTTEQWLEGHTARLGLLPENELAKDPLTAKYGFASANGLFINVNVSFNSLPTGMLVLLEWLEKQECVDFKYAINGGGLDF